MKDKASARARRTAGQNEAAGELDVCIDLLTEMASRGCACKAQLGATPNHSVSPSCRGEKCFCGVDAAHKVSEENLDPPKLPYVHEPDPVVFVQMVTFELSSYICCFHFRQLMGPAVKCGAPADAPDMAFWGHGFKHGFANGLRKAVRLLKTRWRRYKGDKS